MKAILIADDNRFIRRCIHQVLEEEVILRSAVKQRMGERPLQWPSAYDRMPWCWIS